MVALPRALDTAPLTPAPPKGTRRPPAPFVVTAGAVDSASNQCIWSWLDGRHTGEGIHSWLLRVGALALAEANGQGGIYTHAQIVWTFEITPRGARLIKVENVGGYVPSFSAGFRDALARYMPYGRIR